MNDARDLRIRLEALLAEAREHGWLEEIEPLLHAALNDARAAVARAVTGPLAPEVPMRFGMVGDSPGMQHLFALLEKVAASNVPVLVYGETGSGKELVARALHEHGDRAGGPFVAENCAAVPAALLESELFGHTKGSFTGAISDRPGHFVTASHGTMFLDEIGDMPPDMQAKLLRVLEQGEVRPVGSNKPVSIDVRVVAATHRDLQAMVADKRFREDLYYRLNVVRLDLPPLREREGDVLHLARFILARVATEIGVADAEITPTALDALQRWRWPGNVRELENEIRRALTLTGGRIDRQDLSPAILSGV